MPPDRTGDSLNEREKEALRLLRAGHDAKSAARLLDVSVHTLNDRLREARRKLGVTSSREAARLLGEAEAPAETGEPKFIGGKDLGISAPDIGEERTGRPYWPKGAGRPLAWFAGGALAMFIAIALMLSPTLLHKAVDTAPAAQAPTAPVVAETDATRAARAWIALMDSQRWAQSWDAASQQTRSSATQAEWATAMQAIRQPLGAASARTLKLAVRDDEPDGRKQLVEIVQFNTSFAQKPNATESLIMTRDGDGWKVMVYGIE